MSTKVILALVAIAALTVIPAVIQGQLENRWGNPPDLKGASESVELIPREFGNWTYLEDGDRLHPDVCRELGVVGYMSRAYKNRQDGTVVRILLMVGQSNRLLRHPPYICYANMDNEQIGDMTKLKSSGTTPASELYLLEYKRARSVTNDRFLVAYGLATDAVWKVPNMPRIAFGGAPLLYKLQILTALDPSQSREAGAKVITQFADDFCMAFQQHVKSLDQAAPAEPAT